MYRNRRQSALNSSKAWDSLKPNKKKDKNEKEEDKMDEDKKEENHPLEELNTSVSSSEKSNGPSAKSDSSSDEAEEPSVKSDKSANKSDGSSDKSLGWDEAKREEFRIQVIENTIHLLTFEKPVKPPDKSSASSSAKKEIEREENKEGILSDGPSAITKKDEKEIEIIPIIPSASTSASSSASPSEKKDEKEVEIVSSVKSSARQLADKIKIPLIVKRKEMKLQQRLKQLFKKPFTQIEYDKVKQLISDMEEDLPDVDEETVNEAFLMNTIRENNELKEENKKLQEDIQHQKTRVKFYKKMLAENSIDFKTGKPSDGSSAKSSDGSSDKEVNTQSSLTSSAGTSATTSAKPSAKPSAEPSAKKSVKKSAKSASSSNDPQPGCSQWFCKECNMVS
jgi:hypothetical protein